MADGGELARKRRLIVDYEEMFARWVATRVIEKPALSVWMILLPILLLHYFYRLQKFQAGTKAFTPHYLRPRLKALDLAVGGDLPPLSSPSAAALPEGASERLRDAERAYVSVLADHFRRLLAAAGDDYPALVRSAYGDVADYERYVVDSGEAFAAINDVVLDIGNVGDGVGDIVRQMESALRDLHRRETDRLFTR